MSEKQQKGVNKVTEKVEFPSFSLLCDENVIGLWLRDLFYTTKLIIIIFL